MELAGITVELQAKRAYRRYTCKPFSINGGADRDRTDDLCIANAALSQLSYSPMENI